MRQGNGGLGLLVTVSFALLGIPAGVAASHYDGSPLRGS